jgi:hypothetical protein
MAGAERALDPESLLTLAGRPAAFNAVAVENVNTEHRHRHNSAVRETLIWAPWFAAAEGRAVTAAHSPYGLMPKHLSFAGPDDIVGHYKSMEFKKPDSVIGIGRLDPAAYELFHLPQPLPRAKNKTTVWVKTPGEDRLRLPVDMARFLPAVDIFAQMELANLPSSLLWKYVRMRIGFDAGLVPAGVHQRIGNRPHQDLGGPLSKTVEAFNTASGAKLLLPHVNGNLYAVHDEAPTIFFDRVDYKPLADDPEIRKAVLSRPVSFENGMVLKYNWFNWHLAGKVPYETFRNFMAVQTDIDRQMLSADVAGDAHLEQAVRDWIDRAPRPAMLHVPAGIDTAPFTMRRHEVGDVYNYDAARREVCGLARPVPL